MSKKIDTEAWEMLIGRDEDFESSILHEPDLPLLKPTEIVAGLDQYVVGHSEAKQLIAVSVFNRLQALNNDCRGNNDLYFEKNNVLLMGHTGSGKTHILRSLRKILNIPISIQDATAFTSSGYVGGDVERTVDDLYTDSVSIVNNLHGSSMYSKSDVADMAKMLCRYGIIYIDEADKIRAQTSVSDRDVGGRNLQEAFLKLVEGTEVNLVGQNKGTTIDTSNILFIFGGSFSGILDIVNRRLSSNSVGFTGTPVSKADVKNLKMVNIKDLTDFGIIPELLGRLPTVAILDHLSDNTIAKIFIEPCNSILSQITNEFKSHGTDIYFTDDAILFIVKQSVKLGLGARGLKSVSQKALRPLYYSMPLHGDCEILVTGEFLEKNWEAQDAVS